MFLAQVGRLGGAGTDYAGFLQHAGVPSFDMGFYSGGGRGAGLDLCLYRGTGRDGDFVPISRDRVNFEPISRTQ